MTLVKGERAIRILDILREHYGARPWNWHTQQSPFRVLVGTVLSQRTRDPLTDEAAQRLFAAFPSPEEIAHAPLEQIESRIQSVNYYKTKAKYIKEICRILVEEHAGRIPEDMAELRKLPGVGAKTAGCVLVYGFGKMAIPVDTHVHRICNRLGLIRTKTPEESERELWKVIHKDYVTSVNDLMVKHGQSICRPQRPQCPACPVRELCDHEPKQAGQP